MNAEAKSKDGRLVNSPASAGRAIETKDLDVYYSDFLAVRDVNLDIQRNKFTAIIGPSGCGKSTLLRAFNRMNELVPTARTQGQVIFLGNNIYAQDVDPVEVRHHIGMVFQKPNPFPKSVYENAALGARVNGFKGDLDELVEQSLKAAALWTEVEDKLDHNGLSLSGGAAAAPMHRARDRG
jgi:phosphate transport system ATP-binding protein